MEGSPWPVRVRDPGFECGHRSVGPIGFGPVMCRLLDLYVAAPFESPADLASRWFTLRIHSDAVLQGHSRWAIMRFKSRSQAPDTILITKGERAHEA